MLSIVLVHAIDIFDLVVDRVLPRSALGLDTALCATRPARLTAQAPCATVGVRADSASAQRDSGIDARTSIPELVNSGMLVPRLCNRWAASP